MMLLTVTTTLDRALYYMAPRYRLDRTIVPDTKDRFTNNLPDLSQLLCVPINTHELDEMTSNMDTIFSNTLEAVAPIKLKKIREIHTTAISILSIKKLIILSANGEFNFFRIAWKNNISSYRQVLKAAYPQSHRK